MSTTRRTASRAPIAETLARNANALTLLLPAGVRGFVSTNDGSSFLCRVLVPIDREPDPHIAIEAATQLGESLSDVPVIYTALHVGDERDMPELEITERVQDHLDYEVKQGDVAEQIVATAEEMGSGLIVLTSPRPKRHLRTSRPRREVPRSDRAGVLVPQDPVSQPPSRVNLVPDTSLSLWGSIWCLARN